jgi:predicted AlkP superfamily phosphohydrolase/phosphomutase
METDRLHHFLWAEMEQGHPEFAPRFFAFYEQIDGFLGRVRDRLDEQTTLIVMSDHGFCRLRQEVYVNHWLAEQGWLRFKNTPPKGLPDVSPKSVAYALDPGRIFVNADVTPDQKAYQRLRQEIMDAALALRDPESGHPIVAQAFGKEEIYQGPHLDRAADIILHPHDGFDLKGSLGKETLTYIGDELVGMHTYDDAALYISDQTMVVDDPWVADPMPTILKLLDVPLPHGLDGRLLVK